MSDTDLRESLILKLGRDVLMSHRALFRHRHPEETRSYHDTIISDWHSDHPRVLTMVFRGGGKTTIAEEAIIVMACFRKFKYGLLIGETQDRAKERLAAIKHEIETNEFISDLFGDLVGKKWQETYIELSNGSAIRAVGRDQSLRGMKFLSYRPDIAFLDDLEDEQSVSKAEQRSHTLEWYFKTLVPALDPRARIRMAATPLHPEALALSLARSPEWLVRKYPLLIVGDDGDVCSAWPDRYPLSWCESKRAEYESLGKLGAWQQEYMCEVDDPSDKVFTLDMFRYEPVVRSWQPVYVVYDPARTTKSTSAMTGKVVGSWVENRLIIWEASGYLWKPDEIINDIFQTDERYNPVLIGIEKDGLEDFIMQPLLHAQVQRGHLLPLEGLKAPKGKLDFIRSLQPFFKAGEVIFSGNRTGFSITESQLLSFPTGRIDVPNALAYFLKLRPGVPIYDGFMASHIVEDLQPIPKVPLTLCLNATNRATTAVLVQVRGSQVSILHDCVKDGDPGLVLKDIVQELQLLVKQPFTAVAPRSHFETYDPIGLAKVARKIGLSIGRGGDILKGRQELRKCMTTTPHGKPGFRISDRATWALRGISGGYARDFGQDIAKDNVYKVLCESIESYVGLSSGFMSQTSEPPVYATTPDGRRYISALSQN